MGVCTARNIFFVVVPNAPVAPPLHGVLGRLVHKVVVLGAAGLGQVLSMPEPPERDSHNKIGVYKTANPEMFRYLVASGNTLGG